MPTEFKIGSRSSEIRVSQVPCSQRGGSPKSVTKPNGENEANFVRRLIYKNVRFEIDVMTVMQLRCENMVSIDFSYITGSFLYQIATQNRTVSMLFHFIMIFPFKSL